MVCKPQAQHSPGKDGGCKLVLPAVSAVTGGKRDGGAIQFQHHSPRAHELLCVGIDIENGWIRLLVTGLICLAAIGLAGYLVGLDSQEREFVSNLGPVRKIIGLLPAKAHRGQGR